MLGEVQKTSVAPGFTSLFFKTSHFLSIPFLVNFFTLLLFCISYWLDLSDVGFP